MQTSDQRFEELSQLGEGWLDGNSPVIDPAVIREAKGVVETLKFAPRIYPTPFGGIELDYGDVTIELNPDPHGGWVVVGEHHFSTVED